MKDALPAFSEIIDKHKTQVGEIIAACQGKLDVSLPKPFLNIRDLRGMFQFMLKVETRHLDTIMHIKKTMGKAKLVK